ncbi:plakophilin-2-like isoform X2 [Xiphophorus couchianus]|uniref:plakophilin-2-like isoform X2 n=1 Tax=Xiphophorus couchianus TaxID=32473 RepID=UPI001016ED66|nr:plakophilin-2-like isoform X2 [Xiphophorus couchianus]
MERRHLKSRRSEFLYQQPASLASPTEPTPKSFMTGILSDEKNLLVAPNRAQLSLRKNGVSNGGASLQNSSRSSDGVAFFTKVNGSDLGGLSSKGIQARKTSERVAMSPCPGADRFGSGTRFQRPASGCDRRHLRTVGALADWPDGLNPQYQCAVSETSRSTPTRASAHQPGKSRSNSLTHQSVRTKNLSASMAGQYSFRNGQNQKHGFVKHDRQTVQRRTSGRLGTTHIDGGFVQLAPISQRRESGNAERFTNRQAPSHKIGGTICDLSPRQSAPKPPEMTIKRAVNLLDKMNEEELICAAAYIQNQCWRKDEARVEVQTENGARKLVLLLKIDNEEVQRAAAGALRNVVYKNGDNKKDVTDEDGLTVILKLLNETHDKETVCQLAGLLWNLSSDDTIKKRFDENFPRLLTKVILVPFSHINGEAESKRDLIADPNAFLCATACLRNLSSDCNHRRNMRRCENLIDSLVFYTTETATQRTPDDECTKNCVCILQNLTYEAEEDCIPQTTKNKEETQQNATPKETTCSCFPYRRADLGKDPTDSEEAEKGRLLQSNDDPHGAQWLWSGQLVRAYLSLLACNKDKMTLEAAMGALQNLTISEYVARIIKEQNGPGKIKTLLKNDVMLKKPALLLIRNLSRFPDLHGSIFDNLLSAKDTKTFIHYLDISAEESAELMPILCGILVNLSKNSVETASYLSRHTDVNDMLQKKYTGKAEQAVEELRDALPRWSLHKHLEEDKTKMPQNSPQQMLQKALKSCNGAQHQEI